jgi:hypothetical protein
MVKMRILVGTIAGGRAWAVGDVADLSKADADLLRVRGLAEVIDKEPPEVAAEEAPAETEPETETATLEPPENAMQKPPKRRRRGR